ncbi:hypothetical protein C1I95_18165 [Micromonospora craterilacus]|uniref:Uncharacterized protein n=1 Tax=Micromonospora craterilacus TaxID=1655439 RepID=A0A2W2DW95_9ACTN|nr:hypothetical protein [Micromonospora craterilacus]PZG16156.1 hypothetical protein C1I95_18165 [Micromonospora craterilacus]
MATIIGGTIQPGPQEGCVGRTAGQPPQEGCVGRAVGQPPQPGDAASGSVPTTAASALAATAVE